ncbi:MAG: TetR/AcrR family transcriptional regulator [Xanthomonadales bacterium]|nr:TetR/AcrR family transcriptional regulator [Xanthomonadales bacterium]
MPQTAVSSDKARLSAEDWVDAALETIKESGVGAVAVESLAKRLGVTKGSFYWHFPNREALIDAALRKWEENDIRTFERSLSIIKDPHDKMRAVFRRTRKEITSHVLFCHLFMAVDHPRVAEVMQRVSERRIDFLCQGFMELGMAPADARNRARLTFMNYVGFLQYYQNFKSARMDLDELDEYVEHVIRTLIPEPATA